MHLLSVVLVLPCTGLAAAFLILGHAIAAGSLWGFLDRLARAATWLMPWGLLAAGGVLVAIALGGFFARTRWIAGTTVALLGLGSTVIVQVMPKGHTHASFDELAFFIPGLIASCIGAWLAVTEYRTVHRTVTAR